MSTTLALSQKSSPVAQETLPAPRGSRALRHSLVLAKRNLIKTWRTPEQLIDLTLTPVVFLLLFVYVLGGAFGGGSRHLYLQFLLPGLLGQGIAMGSIALGQNMNADIEKGVFDRFRSLPIGRSVPLVGAVLADFLRYLVICVIYIAFGYVIGFRIATNPAAALAAVGLTVAFALCFCWISIWVGMLARNPGSVQGMMIMIVLPLSFGSNTFVKTSTMPGWLRAFADVNPITKLVGAVRGLMLGGPVAADLAWTLGWMAALLATFVPLAMRAYRRRV